MPIRSCRVCRQRAEKSTLTRWTAGPEGWVIDPTQRAQARGIYSHSGVCSTRLQSNQKKRR